MASSLRAGGPTTKRLRDEAPAELGVATQASPPRHDGARANRIVGRLRDRSCVAFLNEGE